MTTITVKPASLCFRPLAGSKVSEQLKTAVHALKISACFRPLSGIKVSEQATYQMVHLTMVCFRPLAGIKVSEHLP